MDSGPSAPLLGSATKDLEYGKRHEMTKDEDGEYSNTKGLDNKQLLQ